jgi:HYR domain
MKIRMVRLAAAFVVAGSLVSGLEYGDVSAAGNQAPIVDGGSLTARYEDVYSIHYTASDPDGDALTLVVPPINEDWIACDDGPATSFTCEYSSSRYYDGAPLPSEPFQKSISYSVSDGTTTATGVWTVTVQPPPTLQIIGRPTVTEGGEAVLQLQASSNTYGSLLFPAHVVAVDTVDGSATSSTDFVIELADGQTVAELRIPIDDDEIVEPTEYFTVSVDAADAVPFRFAGGDNLVTVLDNDGKVSGDTTAPVVAKHRNVVVDRGGSRPAWVSFAPPTATDAVDGTLPAQCNPAPMAAMPVGQSKVACTATDASGNSGSTTFQINVRSLKGNGSAKVVGGYRQCLTSGQSVWVEAEGYTANSNVTIQLQQSNLEITRLKTVRADKKGRVRLLVKVPTVVAAGDADVVVTGPAGNDDLVRMIPVKIARNRHHYGRMISFLGNRQCD